MLWILAACTSGEGGGGAKPAAASHALQAQSSGPDRCALLTDNEVDAAIGPHRSGRNDLTNQWTLQSCRWVATTAQKAEAYPNGWFDHVEVAVFDSLRTSWAREQARGEPVSGFEGALYDSSSGEVWFPCARGRYCVVKAGTASGRNREQIAIRLGQLVEKRLR